MACVELGTDLVTQGYIEDKKKSTQKDDDSVMYADRKTVLLEAQRSLISMIQLWKISCVHCSGSRRADTPIKTHRC